jgi:hypothetical protein
MSPRRAQAIPLTETERLAVLARFAPNLASHTPGFDAPASEDRFHEDFTEDALAFVDAVTRAGWAHHLRLGGLGSDSRRGTPVTTAPPFSERDRQSAGEGTYHTHTRGTVFGRHAQPSFANGVLHAIATRAEALQAATESAKDTTA